MLTMTIVRNVHFCELTFSGKLTGLPVRRDACILLFGEFYILEYHITYLLLKTDSVTCEKTCLHSALGGGAAPSPQSTPPAFLYLNSSYISWG